MKLNRWAALACYMGLAGCSPIEKIPETKIVYQKTVENKDPCGRGSRLLVSGLEYTIVDNPRAIDYFAKPLGLVPSKELSKPVFGPEDYTKLKIIAPKIDFFSDQYLSPEEITDQKMINIAGNAWEMYRRQEIVERIKAERRSKPTIQQPNLGE